MPTLASAHGFSDVDTLETDAWLLSSPLDATSVLAVSVIPGWSPTTQRESGVFAPKGRDRKVVVWGDTYGITGQLAVRALSKAVYDDVKALLLAEAVVLLRSPWGQAFYLAITGDVTESPMRAQPELNEIWPLRHAHVLAAPVVEVDPPS